MLKPNDSVIKVQTDTNQWVDLELAQINRNSIKVGWSPVYIEKTAINGYTTRRLVGHRLTASLSYPYLFPNDRTMLYNLLTKQEESGGNSLYCKVHVMGVPPKKSASGQGGSITNGIYSGYFFLDVNDEQQIFSYSPTLNSYVWTGISIKLVSQEIY